MVTRLPKEVRFLLAESVREEVGGKLSLAGLYSGDEVVMQGVLPSQLPPGVGGVALQHGLTVLALMKGGSGEFDLNMKILAPDGSQLAISENIKVNLQPDRTGNLIVPAIPFPVHSFGTYRVQLFFGKKMYEYKFLIRHQDRTAQLPTRLPEPKVAAEGEKGPYLQKPKYGGRGKTRAKRKSN